MPDLMSNSFFVSKVKLIKKKDDLKSMWTCYPVLFIVLTNTVKTCM